MAVKPKFAVGSLVAFGEEKWIVVKYHKVCGYWEVMFRSAVSGVHRSIPCSQLETYF